MGIATPSIPACVNSSNSRNYSGKKSLLNSMSQDYHQAGIFSFSNGSFDRSQQENQQTRKEKLRMQGFEPPPPFVGMEEAVLPVYENAGMLQEMFSYHSGSVGTATELLENQISQAGYNRIPRTINPPSAAEWFLNRQGIGSGMGESKNHQISNINADSAAAMQLFLMNPQQQRSPPPSPPQNSLPNPSTLHMLLPNQSSPANLSFQTAPGGGGFSQFAWIQNSGNEANPNDHLPGIVGQGLSLSLSSSLQQLEAAKAEELRMEDGGMIFFGHGGGGSKNTVGEISPNFGAVNILRNSKYSKAAQQLLEEFCSVGRGQLKKNNVRTNPDEFPPTKEVPPLSAAERVEHQKRKVKLLSMLDEVDRRYNHYCEQMQMVVNSFDMVMGFGSAIPYTCLAQKAMSRHFRCLKDAISAQVKHTCELLGEKDAGSSGITKGETPRLRMLEQSLRRQRAFHHIGIMEQEAWRPQRGLPERSVNILRAWLFEHFLHPYPSDADKHLLARQTGLSRNQVSNWFINARVRLWKPMVEEMYQQESKDILAEESQRDQTSSSSAHINNSQTPSPHMPATATPVAVTATSNSTAATPLPAMHVSDMASRNHAHVESVLRGLGPGSGDVSLTLGLRHAGNLTEKNPPFFGLG